MGTSWGDFQREAADFAAYVRGRFEEHGLGLLATLARDGSPRISGLEPIFFDQDLWLGMMPDSVKGRDLRRDGRFALHNATIDKDVTLGDVKIQGLAVLVTRREEPGTPSVGHEADLFRAELRRVSSVQVAGDHLLIRTWRPGHPVSARERY